MVKMLNMKKALFVIGCIGLSNALTVFHLTNPYDMLQGLSHENLDLKGKPVSHRTLAFIQKKVKGYSSKKNSASEAIDGLSSVTGVNFKTTPLSQEAFKLQSNTLFSQAENKRKVAKYLQEQSGMTESELTKVEVDANKSPEKEAAITNMKRAKVLLAQAYILEEEAKRMQLAAERSGNNESFKCDILKIGPLAFAPNSEEITDIMDGSLGLLNGNMLSIYYNSIPKESFSLESIEMPVYNVDAAPGCFAFKYHGTEQVICASGKDSQSAWINAITEAWFCRNLGLAGTLPTTNKSQDKEKTEENKEGDDEEDDDNEDEENENSEDEKKEAKSTENKKPTRYTRSSVKTFTVELEDGKPKITQN
ncbi:hypothetical protein FG379_000797 [Cryptosporidium bovis]|uniref:uncharacterized protein n=1 Tax=Cryptosporidium bovis TaxID=310047 RepID=UPI00351AAA82|nr:hypothetical protein FG379_000797 [Cryptosporidium bovis]